MHYFTFLKNTSVIVDYRVDNSIPNYWTAESLHASVAKTKNLNYEDIETICLPDGAGYQDENCKTPIGPSSHLFNKSTNKVTDNPDYVITPVIEYLSVEKIRKNLTLVERVKWDNDKSDTIKTAKIELAPGLLKAEATEVLQLLVDAGDISAASMQKILA